MDSLYLSLIALKYENHEETSPLAMKAPLKTSDSWSFDSPGFDSKKRNLGYKKHPKKFLLSEILEPLY